MNHKKISLMGIFLGALVGLFVYVSPLLLIASPYCQPYHYKSASYVCNLTADIIPILLILIIFLLPLSLFVFGLLGNFLGLAYRGHFNLDPMIEESKKIRYL